VIHGNEPQEPIGRSILPDHPTLPLREAIRLNADQHREPVE
jgi:hypothetical protein